MTDEGRAVKNGNDFEYEYFLTDHLGNTRLTFGWLKDKDVFKATMETENNTEESVNFIKLDTRATSVANNHTASYEVEGTANEAARLNGFDNTAVGPGIVLENVVAGDKVSAEVFARYSQSTSTNATVSTTMFSLVASAFGIVNGGETAALYSHFDNNWAATLGTIASSGSNEPKAYLNYIIFRDGLSGVPQFGFIPVTTAASTDFEKLSFEIDIPYSGDMYIYVANESNEQDLFVWFDDLKVVHQKNSWGMEVTGADDYYPFGLQIGQNSYQIEWDTEQNYKFNGKEEQEETGLYDFETRGYDPALGRFHQIDYLAETMPGITPYAFVFNNPLKFIDPTGMAPVYNWDDGKYYDDETGEEVSWSGVQSYLGIGGGDEGDNDQALVIAFPDAKADIPQDGSFWEWGGSLFDNDDNGKLDVGHAGIVLIDGETGNTFYFDYGRYSIPGLGKRGKNKGAVRSSASFGGGINDPNSLAIPNAVIEGGQATNIDQILSSVYNKNRLGQKYGRMIAALYTGLNFEAMVGYARQRELQGYTTFQCPTGDYCARFVRQVIDAGGGGFPGYVFTGEQNVRSTAAWYRWDNPSKVYEYGGN